jgi:hypothetical protein
MNSTPRLLRLALALPVCALLTACFQTTEGPALPPDPNAQNVIYGKEPQHAPIPQKDVPADESSLTHKKPDQRIDRP